MKFRLMAAMGLLLMLPVDPVFAQSSRTASSRSQDLWGIWREGFSHYEKAEKARIAKRYEEALNEYRASLQAFQRVRRRDSDWNRTVISYRIDLCLRRINLVQEAQTAARTKTPPAQPKTPTVQQKAAPVLKQVVQREDFVEQAMKARARLAEAEKEIATLKRSIELNSKAAEQVKSLIREKNELIQKNAAINLLLENAKARLARADKSADKDRRIVEEKAKVTALTSQLKNMRVEMETLKLQKAEAQSRRNEAELALKQNVQHITTLTAAIEAAKQVRAENQKLLAQLNEMKNDKAEMEKRLADATRKINDLSGQLSQIREGISLPENIRRIQDNANVVLKDNEYLRTLNTKNMKELELLRKSNAAASEELAKLKELYSRTSGETASAAKAAEESRLKLEAEQKVSSGYRNTVELLQKERDSLKKDLSAFAQKYETLLKSASRSDTLSAELLKREAELKQLGERAAGLDLALTKLRQENTALAEEAKKAREEVRSIKMRMEQQLAALKANADKISGENAALKKEAAALKESLAKSAEIEKKTVELSAENIRLQKESSDLKASIERYGRETAGGKLLAAENDRLKSQASGLENDLKQAVAAKTALASEYAKLKTRAEELRRNFEKAYAERNKLLKENNSFKETSAAAKEAAAKYAETVKNSNRLSEEYTKLKNDYEAFKQAVARTNQASFSAAALSVENESLKQEVAKLKAAQEKLGNKPSSAALAQENARLNQELNALKRSIGGTENGKLAGEFAKLKELSGRSEQLLAENDKLKKEVLELKALTVKYRNLPADANSALKENENLKIEIASLKETVARLMKMAENPQTSTRQIELTVHENTSLRTESAKLKKHISMLNAELRENEMLRKNNEEQIQKLLASGKNTDEFLRQRDQKIKQLNAEIARLKKRAGVPASKEIAELSATVTELREGKVQFETALRNLTAARTKLEEENKKLKTSLELAQREAEALKKQLTRPQPQGVLERRNLELLESATKFESLYTKTSKERDELAARIKALDKEILDSKNQLNTANITMERMRKELLQWTDDPTGMSDQTIHRKDQAIDVLVAEGESLRKEVARLKTQLLVANDTARRYREKNVEMEQRFRLVLSSIKDYKNLNPDRILSAEQEKKAAQEAEEARKLAKHKELVDRLAKQRAEKAKAKAAEKNADQPTSAQSAHEQKRYEEAMSMARKAENNKDSAGALMNYWRAADANPKSAEAYLGLTRAYLERGESASAAKSYETARKLGAPQNLELEQKLNAGSH